MPGKTGAAERQRSLEYLELLHLRIWMSLAGSEALWKVLGLGALGFRLVWVFGFLDVLKVLDLGRAV